MENEKIFEQFNNGKLYLSKDIRSFSDIPWTKHSAFDGVELKHLVTASDTGSRFSYHLVRIAPNKKIGLHTHETQLETHEVIAGNGICKNGGKELSYEPGVLCILEAGSAHEVTAAEDGLYLFAKFIPSLC